MAMKKAASESLVFDDRLKIYAIAPNNSKVFEFPPNVTQTLFGKTFSGTSVYTGRNLTAVNQINNPLLFVDIDNFLAAVLGPANSSGNKAIGGLVRSIECVVIAQ